MQDLKGKVVLVTGAGSGIGKATAIKFATYGSKVIIAGRNVENHLNTLETLKTFSDDCRFIQTDITDESDVIALIKSIVDEFGRLDIAVNNAGVFGSNGKINEDNRENYDLVTSTNITGLWLCMKYESEQMLKQGGGAIVNCSSVAGVQGHLASAVYAASKHATIGMSKSAALQYARHGIRVNILCPGSTNTEMLRSVYPSEEALLSRASLLPMGRFGDPEEVANCALFLGSDMSSFVTGQVLCADAGVTAGRGETKSAVS